MKGNTERIMVRFILVVSWESLKSFSHQTQANPLGKANTIIVTSNARGATPDVVSRWQRAPTHRGKPKPLEKQTILGVEHQIR